MAGGAMERHCVCGNVLRQSSICKEGKSVASQRHTDVQLQSNQSEYLTFAARQRDPDSTKTYVHAVDEDLGAALSRVITPAN